MRMILVSIKKYEDGCAELAPPETRISKICKYSSFFKKKSDKCFGEQRGNQKFLKCNSYKFVTQRCSKRNL